MNNIKETVQETIKDKFSSKRNNLAKVEGILTSPIKLKEPREDRPYFWAFFQLEGISHDIPVIFKMKCPMGNSIKPEIPFRAKVLLKGTWSESLTSPRPSFTCTDYSILEPPPPPALKDLREQISTLLSLSLDQQSQWKQRTDYLFKKKRDLEEVDKLTKLGEEYLSAYLLIRRAFYSNYQDNLLSHNHWNQEEYLTKLQGEIEDIACQVRAYQSKEKDIF
jgi:hypothetical protein